MFYSINKCVITTNLACYNWEKFLFTIIYGYNICYDNYLIGIYIEEEVVLINLYNNWDLYIQNVQ